jgi:hypothetical protein
MDVWYADIAGANIGAFSTSYKPLFFKQVESMLNDNYSRKF